MPKLNAYQLKWIAVTDMMLFHAAYHFQEILPLPLMIVMIGFGGFAFPIMGFFVVEGYKHTKDLKKYILRCLFFGTISIPFYMIVLGTFRFNIMFAIAVSLMVLKLYDTLDKKWLFWIIFVIICIPMLVLFDWLFFGPVVVMMYRLIKNETARRLVPGIVSAVAWLMLSLFALMGLMALNPLLESEGWAVEQRDMIYAMMGNTNAVIASLFFPVACVLAAFLLKNYNNERGKKAKWIFYAFYPVHLIIIAVAGFIFL
ncbi:MAG: conjugal transfer protein TraX [Defluviitaleaceae bacterium]|nr:conjugal transfer protein TraX [Defluviitaleaceae bacterium]